MNVQVSQGGFRFRIVPEELERLLRGEILEQSVCAGADRFFYRIAPEGDVMRLAVAGEGFCLAVPRAALEELRDMGRSRDGIGARQGEADIMLQVDIKTRAKGAA